MKKVLVTGGLGYIGAHTVVELINAGYNPVIIDNLSNTNISVIDGIAKIVGSRPTFYELDVLHGAELQQIIEREQIDAVIHFAASKAVGESIEKPLKYYTNNVGGILSILQASLQNNVSSFVFSSSCTVYGQPDELPVTESSPLQKALSPYGSTKRMCEQMLEDTCAANSAFSGISLRYFNPIGAHDSAHIGELPLGVPANLLPFVTQTAAGLREQLLVFGNNYHTPDGTAIRDYIHVVDLAKAHIRAIERKQDKNYEVFNVGTGSGYSVLEIIKAFERVNDIQLNYKIVERRPGDIEKIWADTNLANQALDWQAKLTLDDMVRSAWKWQQSLANG